MLFSFPGVPTFKLRETPRRVVMGLVVNHELELTEVRFRQLHRYVDLFIIAESNITAGQGKLFFRERPTCAPLFFDRFAANKSFRGFGVCCIKVRNPSCILCNSFLTWCQVHLFQHVLHFENYLSIQKYLVCGIFFIVTRNWIFKYNENNILWIVRIWLFSLHLKFINRYQMNAC